VRDRLIATIAGETSARRVRLTLAGDGEVQVTVVPFVAEATDATWRYAISERRTDSSDPLFHHKTTSRAIYDEELARLRDACGVDEVVFVNERGEVTEGSRTTIFLERDGRWLTPPLASGVLDGCLRREMIERGDPIIEERVLTADDLASGQVWFGNALRGLIRGRSISPAIAA